MYDGELKFKSNGEVWPIPGGRPNGVFVRYSNPEMAYVDKRAALLGVRRSALLYVAALIFEPAPEAPPRFRTDVRVAQSHAALHADVSARLLPQLGRVGNNLNQLARTANTTGWADPAELTAAIAELSAVMADFRRVAGWLR